MFPKFFLQQFQKNLNPSQVETLKILIWLLQVHKQVRIERLAACLPLPILYESRRQHLQRFLVLEQLDIEIIWLPLVKYIIEQEFTSNQDLIVAIDRTNWKNNNILIVSVIWKIILKRFLKFTRLVMVLKLYLKIVRLVAII